MKKSEKKNTFRYLLLPMSVYNFGIVLSIVIPYIFLTFTDIGLIPDGFDISLSKDPRFLLQVIISGSIALIGVAIAVVILAFGILRKRLGRSAHKNLLANNDFRRLLTMVLTTILIAFYTLAESSKGIESNGQLSAYYFCMILFVLTVISFFPMAFKILSYGNSFATIREAFDRLSKDDIEHFQYKSNGAKNVFEYIENYEEYPIVQLQSIGTRSANDDDYMICQLFINAGREKIFNELTKDIDENKVFTYLGVLFEIWKGLIREALKHNNRIALRSILINVEIMYEHIANHKLSLFEFYPLHSFLEEFIADLRSENYNDLVIEGMEVYSKNVQFQVERNCPDGDKISVLNDYGIEGMDEKVERHWDAIIDNISHLSSLASSGLEAKQTIIYTGAMAKMNFLIRFIYARKIPLKVRGGLMRYLSINIYSCAMAALDRKFIEVLRKNGMFDYSDIRYTVEENDTAYKQLLELQYYYYWSAIKKGYTIDHWDLNEIATIGRYSTSKMETNPREKEIFYYTTDFFNFLRERISSGEIKTDPEFIKNLKAQFASISKMYFERNGTADNVTTTYLNSLSSKFSTLPSQPENTNDFIAWQNFPVAPDEPVSES